VEWGHSVMWGFSSLAYRTACTVLLQKLQTPAVISEFGISETEASAIIAALYSPPTDIKEIGSIKDPFLRELCSGGAIETLLPELKGWENRHRRYRLIYRLMRLLPEDYPLAYKSSDPTAKSKTGILKLRKSTLYGLSEVERGAAYLRELDAISELPSSKSSTLPESGPWSRLQTTMRHLSPSSSEMKEDKVLYHVSRLLELVRYAQHGDRAFYDYRQFKSQAAEGDGWFEKTTWATDGRNDVSEVAIRRWISENQELVEIPGGFERSLPEIDELADEVDKVFDKQAAVRVSAAGLGGRVCIHALTRVLPSLMDFLEKKGWKVRQLQPGSPTQLLHL